MSFSTVINERNKSRYTVDSYHLKVLKCDLPDLKEVDPGVLQEGFKTFDEIEAREGKAAPIKVVETSLSEMPIGDNLEPIVNESHDELIESLLKKADDFSSKYLKAQMELETFKEETLAKETELKDEAFKAGQEAALEGEAKQAQQLESAVTDQMKNSVEALSLESSNFSQALTSVKQELVSAALEIAKEVIVKELDQHANEISLKLASSLMNEIDRKSDITLRVHPNQLETFTTALVAESNIKVVADKAVSDGGVIILSDMGTIEANIMERFEHIKRNALSK